MLVEFFAIYPIFKSNFRDGSKDGINKTVTIKFLYNGILAGWRSYEIWQSRLQKRRVLFDLSALAESPTFKSFPTCKISQSRLKLHHMKYSKEEDFSLPIFASYHRIPPLSFSKKSTFFSSLPHFLSPPRPTDPLLIRFPATVLLPSH